MDSLFSAAGVFGLPGLVGLVWGTLTLRTTRRFVAGSAVATATVTNIDSALAGGAEQGPRVAKIPTVAFSTADGTRVEARLPFGSSAFNYRPGDTLQVRYNLTAPAAVRLDSFVGLWAIPVCVGVISAGFLFASTVIALAALFR